MKYLQSINKATAIKMTKKFLIITIILSILQPTIILSKMPPNSVKKNDNGEIIVIGEVYDKGAALLVINPSERPDKPPLTQFIVLKVIQVIKGGGKIKPNDLIHILSHDDQKKQHDPNICHTERIFPIQAEKGILLIVYADTVSNNPGFYSKRTIFPFLSLNFLVGLY